MTILRIPFGLGLGTGRYYGWRLYIHAGPLILLIWRCSPSPAVQ
jgi:hypothetical protein